MNPNMLSLISLILAVVAAIFFVIDWREGLLFAAIFVLFSGLFDALDGKVARISSKASKRGDFVDHVIDRYSDAIILAAIAYIFRENATCILCCLKKPGLLFTLVSNGPATFLELPRRYSSS